MHRATLAFAMAIGLAAADSASAQTAGQTAGQMDGSRFEVGGQFSALRLSDLKSTNPGFGGRFAYDFSDWVAAEAEANFFPHEDFRTVGIGTLAPDLRVTSYRRRGEAFFGAKIGKRTQRFGLFAKVRPGFTRLTGGGLECSGRDCAVVSLVMPVYRTEFAMDLGGVFEYYPTSRLVARVDVGDTMIRHRGLAPPYVPNSTSHNFTPRFGFGFRF
jgi:hypothetical protein